MRGSLQCLSYMVFLARWQFLLMVCFVLGPGFFNILVLKLFLQRVVAHRNGHRICCCPHPALGVEEPATGADISCRKSVVSGVRAVV